MSQDRYTTKSPKEELHHRLFDLANYLAENDWEHDVPRAVSLSKTQELEFDDEEYDELRFSKLVYEFSAKKSRNNKKAIYTLESTTRNDLLDEEITDVVRYRLNQASLGQAGDNRSAPLTSIDWDSVCITESEKTRYRFDGKARLLGYTAINTLRSDAVRAQQRYDWPSRNQQGIPDGVLQIEGLEDLKIGGMNRGDHLQAALAMLAVLTPRHLW